MREFETLLLLSPELSAENRDGLLTGFCSVIQRDGGKVIDVEHWGMRDLAYPVNKQMRGYYARLVYAGPPELVAELERNIRIADGVYKFLTVRLNEDAAKEDAATEDA